MSKLALRKRTGEADSYDVEVGVSAYDRSEGAAASSPPGARFALNNKKSRGRTSADSLDKMADGSKLGIMPKKVTRVG